MNQPLFSDPQSSLIPFDLPKEQPSIIKVIGVGGGGSNAVNHMYRHGIKGVDFLVCNTDAKALNISPVPDKIQLGPGLTQGMGAGAVPEVGKQAVLESKEEILRHIGEHTRMVFITAGMGGGTGTGAAPIIAGITKEKGILTVGIVTIPFVFEGSKRRKQAEAGIEEMKNNVDALLVICNDKLREMHGNLNISHAFGHADNVLAVAAKSIAEIITNTMHISTDFADIQTVMKDSGVAIMGSAAAEGDNRAIRAAEAALDSPLLNDNVIVGANYILLNITSGNAEVTMDEVGEINDFIQAQAGQTADIIMGIGRDETLGDKISVTVIATGFHTGQKKMVEERKPEVIVHQLVEESNVDIKEQTNFTESSDVISESVNPLEPVLIIRDQVEPVIQQEETLEVPVAEVQNPSEPFLFIREDYVTDAVQNELPSIEPEAEISMPQFASPELNELSVEMKTEDEPEFFIQESDETNFFFGFDEEVSEQNSNLLTFEFPVTMNEEIKVNDEIAEEIQQAEVPLIQAAEESSVVRHDLYNDEPQEVTMQQQVFQNPTPVLSPEDEMYLHSRERIMRLREVSLRINSPSGLADMEKEPAFRRRNVKLDNVPSSAESNVSRYTLSVEENRPEIRSNNPFLHDRVD